MIMKRYIFRGSGALLCLLAMCFLCRTARADVIWTPNDNFFTEHYSECENVARFYLANGENGYVTIRKDPLSGKKTGSKENGTEFFVSFTYTDKKGKEWGVVEFDESTGWIQMEELTVVYDNISFCAEHENEFQDYQGEFDDYVQGKEPLQFYEYPGAGTPKSSMELQQDKPEFAYTYQDPEGRQWGYASYYFAHPYRLQPLPGRQRLFHRVPLQRVSLHPCLHLYPYPALQRHRLCSYPCRSEPGFCCYCRSLPTWTPP
jgi:hypothetical protein